VTVEHDILRASVGGLDNVYDEGGATLWLENLLRNAHNLELINISIHKFHRLLHESVC